MKSQIDNSMETGGGDSAGTHSITKHNYDLFTVDDPNSTLVASVDSASKWTRYNFETLMPKCKPGQTYYIYINTLIDNSYWLGRVKLGQIKLYKDGIVYFKDGSTKREGTMAYVKDNSGTKRKVRYILVKDSNGTKRIIDMYTTHYE
jgi:hypothetical protein